MINGANTNTFNYTYDKIGQLTEVIKNNSAIETYSFDSNGNRLNNNAQYDSQDRLISNSSTTFGYTERGTLLTRTENNQTTSYNYDLMGNLLSVTLPNSTEIEYITDARNRRVAKKVNGTIVQKFLYLNQLEPIAEVDANDNIVSLFIYGTRSNTPDYIIKNNVKYKVVTNQLGSVVKVVNVSSGEIVQSIEYDSFGNILSDSNPNFQPFTLAGGLYDVDTKLIRFGARDYDAREGRWTTKDPIKFDGGMNFYSYCYNNPIFLIDITGENAVSVAIEIGFGLAIGDGPLLPIGDIIGLVIIGGAIIYDFLSSDSNSTPNVSDFIDASGIKNGIDICVPNIMEMSKGKSRNKSETKNDIPEWIRYMRDKWPKPGEDLKKTLRDIMDEKYGKNNWKDTTNTEWSKILKHWYKLRGDGKL